MRTLTLLLLLASCADDLSELRRSEAYNEQHWTWRLEELRKTVPTLQSVPDSAPEALRTDVKNALRNLEHAAALEKQAREAVRVSLAKGRRTPANLVITEQDRLMDASLVMAEASMARAMASVQELPSTKNTDDLAGLARVAGAGTELNFVFTSFAILDVERSRPDLEELERWSRFCRDSGKLELIAFVQGSGDAMAAEKEEAIDDAVDRASAPLARRRGGALRRLFGAGHSPLPLIREGPVERRVNLATQRLGAVTRYLRERGVPVQVVEKQEVEFADLDREMRFAVAVLTPCAK